MKKLLKIGLYIIAVIVILIVIGATFTNLFFTPSGEKSTLPIEETVQPKVVDFPYSWEKTFDPVRGVDPFEGKDIPAVRVTVLNITSMGTEGAEIGYQTYRVYYTLEYLLDKKWISDSGVIVPLLELGTIRGNPYEGLPVTLYRLSDFLPGEEKISYAVFQVRHGEMPFEVMHYDVINPQAPQEEQKLGIAYIWKIEYT